MGPGRHLVVLPPGLCRSRSSHATRALPTVSICTRASRETRSPAHTTSRASSTLRGTIPAGAGQSNEGSSSLLRANGGVCRSDMPGSSTSSSDSSSSSIRRNLRCSGGFQEADWAAAGDKRQHHRQHTRAMLLAHGGVGGGASLRGSSCPSRTRQKQWPPARGDPILLRVAGFRTTVGASRPASSDAGPGSGTTDSGKTQTPTGAVGGSAEGDSEAAHPSPQAESVTAAAAEAQRKSREPPKSAASIGDERITVKGGNPAVRGGHGTFIEMRDRMRHARLDAREDAKDWMRDKRDDMNTMKEVREPVVGGYVHGSRLGFSFGGRGWICFL